MVSHYVEYNALRIDSNNDRSLARSSQDELEEANGEGSLGIALDEKLKFSSHAQGAVVKF